MMSVDPLGRDGAAAYYLEIIAGGVEDYYLAPGEAPGRWLGPAAEALGCAERSAPRTWNPSSPATTPAPPHMWRPG
jgi:hypothetical protein